MTGAQIGEELLALWTDGFLYPAVVVGIEGGILHVAYFDGDELDIPMTSVRRRAIEPGMKVSVNFRGQGEYFRGVVNRRLGSAYLIDYDDGDSGWTHASKIRIPPEVVATMP